MKQKIKKILYANLILLLLCINLYAQKSSEVSQSDLAYVVPVTQTQTPRGLWKEYLDVIVLVVALSLSSYLSLKKRSRVGLFLLMIFSLVYFGFLRSGCICSVGSIQNIALALFDSSYTIPLSVIAFFLLPIVFTMFFGRTFCSSVCPLGAIQDIFILKSIKIPLWLSRILKIFPHIYLWLTLIFVFSGSGFLICRYDPFVSFFRFSGNMIMIILGISVLVLGMFVARPYCRFVCPYGVILGWVARFSKWHLKITPDECILCGLCETSCPFGAINKPNLEQKPEPREKGVSRIKKLLLFSPVWIVGFAFAAEKISAGAWMFGVLFGLVFSGILINLSVQRKQEDYEANKSACLSCGRCFAYCPKEHERLKTKEEK